MRTLPVSAQLMARTRPTPSRASSGSHNAVTSVSLDPLLLLVCLDRGSRTLPALQAAGRFAVNVLREGQEDLARVFASKRPMPEKFEEISHTVAHGVPVLDDALAWLACEVREILPGGDHLIAIGEVVELDADPDGRPLVWWRGEFGGLHYGA